MQHKGTQILETERLILRPFQASDVEPVFQTGLQMKRLPPI
ncbi:GNAT family N-acetyltransferase [Streptococcus suis]|nr:GNAT family N-acetyltransferase [Streptococcus suis]